MGVPACARGADDGEGVGWAGVGWGGVLGDPRTGECAAPAPTCLTPAPAPAPTPAPAPAPAVVTGGTMTGAGAVGAGAMVVGVVAAGAVVLGGAVGLAPEPRDAPSSVREGAEARGADASMDGPRWGKGRGRGRGRGRGPMAKGVSTTRPKPPAGPRLPKLQLPPPPPTPGPAPGPDSPSLAPPAAGDVGECTDMADWGLSSEVLLREEWGPPGEHAGDAGPWAQGGAREATALPAPGTHSGTRGRW